MTDLLKRVVRPRVIPVLLLERGVLVKPVRFGKATYIGDPRVAVKIFNDKGADELVLLDRTAAVERTPPDFRIIEEIAGECFMPLAYGGGVASVEDARRLLGIGLEKIVVNTAGFERPGLIEEVARAIGRQSVVVAIDSKRTLFGANQAMVRGGTRRAGLTTVEAARRAEQWGAGEIILQSIDREGTLGGYDIGLIREVASAVEVPVVSLGGAGSTDDFVQALSAGASAVAAGTMFVLHGPHRAVLVTYPSEDKLRPLLEAGSRRR